MAGSILVKVNLNELPWIDKEVGKRCLGEIEEMALASKGFVRSWHQGILVEPVNFVGEFTTINNATSFGAALLLKPYIGRVSYEHSSSTAKYRIIQKHL